MLLLFFFNATCLSFLLHLDPSNVSAIGPVELIVNHTQMAKFACETFGIPVPNITWVKVSDGSDLYTSTNHIQITEVIMNSFTHVSNLTFLNTTRTDQSEYTCVGSNGIMNVIGSPESDTVRLLVQGELLVLLHTQYQPKFEFLATTFKTTCPFCFWEFGARKTLGLSTLAKAMRINAHS